MEFKIRSHFWPRTPNLREIKFLIDNEIFTSFFMNQDEIWKLAQELRECHDQLMKIADQIEI